MVANERSHRRPTWVVKHIAQCRESRRELGQRWLGSSNVRPSVPWPSLLSSAACTKEIVRSSRLVFLHSKDLGAPMETR